MDNKLAELTDKLYKEGVEKGEEEGAKIIADAEAKAAALVDDAKEEAKRLLAEAKTEAEELRRNVETELKMVGSQILSQVRTQVVDAILAKSVDAPMTAALSDVNTMSEMIKAIAQQWKMGGTGTPTLEVILPEAKRAELEKAFKSALAAELKEGMKLAFSPRVRVGFQVQPVGGGYKLSFTDEDFAELFKDHLRPRTRKMLFGA